MGSGLQADTESPTLMSAQLCRCINRLSSFGKFSGSTGSTGSQGSQGVEGLPGATGNQGNDGNRGATGRPGDGTTIIMMPPASAPSR